VKKIIVFTRYCDLGASSRVRFSLYRTLLEKDGFVLEYYPLFSNKYLLSKYQKKAYLTELIFCYLRRLWDLRVIFRGSVVWLEKEFFPYLPSWAEYFCFILKIRLIVDFDDAIFHNYDLSGNVIIRSLLKKKIDHVMKFSSVVIAGNNYIANRAIKAGSLVVVNIPTVIDYKLYQYFVNPSNQKVVIGWIGSPSTSKYLFSLIPIFKRLSEIHDLHFIAIGGDSMLFEDTLVDVLPWSSDSELSSLSGIDIGVMPLENTPWELGKCGYKIIQYFGMGKAVVASNIGANVDIVDHGKNGFLCDNEDDWFKYLSLLIKSEYLRGEFGNTGKGKVIKQYSLEAGFEKISRIFSEESVL
jgi:glycosyltransferase involved in cell wall biosynthesis